MESIPWIGDVHRRKEQSLGLCVIPPRIGKRSRNDEPQSAGGSVIRSPYRLSRSAPGGPSPSIRSPVNNFRGGGTSALAAERVAADERARVELTAAEREVSRLGRVHGLQAAQRLFD